MTDLSHFIAPLMEALLFISLYGCFSAVFLRAFRKKKPGLRFWDAEIIFASVLASAALTKAVMTVVKKMVL